MGGVEEGVSRAPWERGGRGGKGNNEKGSKRSSKELEGRGG